MTLSFFNPLAGSVTPVRWFCWFSDGSYNQWTPGGPWYYYAMGYGTCKQGQDMCHKCGYGYSWIGVWKSDTMESGTWELVREARDDSVRCRRRLIGLAL